MAANIGLGCVTFGREIDKTASYALMDYARENGIVSFDTAAAYGGGSSETIIGEWLAARGLKNGTIHIATKMLPPYHPQQIQESVHDSLKRLRVDAIDVFYLHRWDTTVTTDTWRMLDKLMHQGKIKALGASNFNTAQIASAVNALQMQGGVKLQYIQNNHNLAVSDINDEMKRICIQNDIRIITYSPLGAGFLTGKHVNGIQKNSRFDIMPAHQDVYFNARAGERLNQLLAVAARTGNNPSFLALAWALHQPGVYEVLAGGRSVAHLDLAIKAKEYNNAEVFARLENS